MSAGFKRWAVWLTVLLLAAGAWAQEVAPDALVKSVTNEVLEILKQNPGREAVPLIEKKVVPHFDFQRMTALAVGRDWNGATTEQRKALEKGFHDLLVRTYSNSLSAYKGQTVNFKPFHAAPGETEVTVRSEVRQPGGAKPVTLDYALEKQGSEWKVFDVTVAGISLVTNYRQQFSQEVKQGGIDGLIKALREKNQRGDVAPAPGASLGPTEVESR